MQPLRPDELAAILDEVEETRTRDIGIDHHSLLPALYTKEFVHRLIPDAVAIRLGVLVGRAMWLWPATRRRAIGRMSLVLSRTGREGEARKLAREQLVAHVVSKEIGMRPWMLWEAPVHGADKLHAAVASGRPVIVMIAHIEGGSSDELWRLGRPVYAAAHPFLSPDFRGTRAGWTGYSARRGWR